MTSELFAVGVAGISAFRLGAARAFSLTLRLRVSRASLGFAGLARGLARLARLARLALSLLAFLLALLMAFLSLHMSFLTLLGRLLGTLSLLFALIILVLALLFPLLCTLLLAFRFSLFGDMVLACLVPLLLACLQSDFRAERLPGITEAHRRLKASAGLALSSFAFALADCPARVRFPGIVSTCKD